MSSRPDTPSAEHVVDLVADAVFGRLDAEQDARVREHLARCGECAADFAWAGAFRAELAHLTAERVVALSEGVSPQPVEREHLEACDACRHEVSVLAALEPPAARRTMRTARLRPRRWQGWSLGAMATAAVVLLLVHPWRGVDLDAVRGLSQLQALPVHVPRAVPDATEFDTLRARGLEAYADARWSEASDALAAAAALNDTDEMRLYLGSARWLAGDATAAEPDLKIVAERAGASPLGEAARWQLANLYLGRGDVDAALPLLHDVAQQGQRFGGAASRLLDQLADAGVDVR